MVNFLFPNNCRVQHIVDRLGNCILLLPPPPPSPPRYVHIFVTFSISKGPHIFMCTHDLNHSVTEQVSRKTDMKMQKATVCPNW